MNYHRYRRAHTVRFSFPCSNGAHPNRSIWTDRPETCDFATLPWTVLITVSAISQRSSVESPDLSGALTCKQRDRETRKHFRNGQDQVPLQLLRGYYAARK